MPTAIEWCDETHNGWWGCAEVSPGCGHCYARTWARFTRAKTPLWPEHGQPASDHAIMVTSEANWRKPLKWARELPEQLGRRPRIFTASMSDVFEEHPDLVEPRKRLLALIQETPELDWLVLTKRPEVARDHYFAGGWTLTENLWLGTSIENARYTWRADVLREIPAAVRFISAEPLLGSLYHSRNGLLPKIEYTDPKSKVKRLDLAGIDWVIIGGESGRKARPFYLEHAREIVSAVRLARSEWRAAGGSDVFHTGPSVFVKQLGAKPMQWSGARDVLGHIEYPLRDGKGGDMDEWPADLCIREFPRSAA